MVEDAKHELESHDKVLDESRIQVAGEIDSSFRQLVQMLGSRKECLQRRLESLHVSQKSAIFHIADSYDSRSSLLSTIVDITEWVLKQSNPFHVILLKKQLEAGTDLFSKEYPTMPDLFPYKYDLLELLSILYTLCK